MIILVLTSLCLFAYLTMPWNRVLFCLNPTELSVSCYLVFNYVSVSRHALSYLGVFGLLACLYSTLVLFLF